MILMPSVVSIVSLILSEERDLLGVIHQTLQGSYMSKIPGVLLGEQAFGKKA